MRDLARAHTAESIAALARIVRKGKSESAVTQAADALLSRGWGKPLQQVEVKRSPLDELTTEQLVEFLASIERAIEVADATAGQKLLTALESGPVEGNA